MADPFDLQRFLDAQAPAMPAVERELLAGRKTSHWMWFVFPQLAALGQSAMARFYGITGLEEARAFLAHPVLGPQLVRCVGLATAAPGQDSVAILGAEDALKFRSCVTLFGVADPAEPAFPAALDRFHAGVPDARTLALLGAAG